MPKEFDTNPAEEVKTLDLEVAPIESITKAEIDCQIATARQFPRSLAQFYKRAEAMVTVDEETAQSCFYRIRRKDNTQPDGYKWIEGESIRMAEIVAANFGNLRSAVHISGHTPTRVSVRAVCHDLETNNLIAVEKQAKTTYKDGSPYNEDMAITTTNALVSKALRDAIFRVVPKALVKPLKEKAKLVAFGTGAAFAERRKKAIEWATKTRKIPIDRVMAVLGVKGEADMTIEHLEILTGLKNAIMEGDQSVDEAFPPLEAETRPAAEHPEKKKQREAQELADTMISEVKSAVVKEQAKNKESAVSKLNGSKPANPDEKEEAAMGLAPEQKQEATPENVVPMAAAATTEAKVESKAETKPVEPEPEKPEAKVEAKPETAVLTEKQAKFKAAMEEAGFNFDQFRDFAAGKFLPKKSDPTCPKDWIQITDERAGWFLASVKGLIAAMKKGK